MYIIIILVIVLVFFIFAAIIRFSESEPFLDCNKIINTYNSHPTLHYLITLEEFLEWLKFFNDVHDIDYCLVADLIAEHIMEERIKEREMKEKEYKKIIERII